MEFMQNFIPIKPKLNTQLTPFQPKNIFIFQLKLKLQ